MFRFARTSLLAGILFATVLSLQTLADSLATLSVSPASSTVSTGSTFSVDVNISGAADLYAYQFDLSFNPAVLQATSLILESSFLSSGGSTTFSAGTIDNSGGNILFNGDSLIGMIPGVNGSGTLMEFNFTSLAAGLSNLTILNNPDLIFLDSSLNTLNTQTVGATVTVQGPTTVPEPSVLFLLSGGLCALLGLRLIRIS